MELIFKINTPQQLIELINRLLDYRNCRAGSKAPKKNHPFVVISTIVGNIKEHPEDLLPELRVVLSCDNATPREILSDIFDAVNIFPET